MRLLLVEDSRRLRESLGVGLRRLGYSMDVACDGEEGLQAALANPYDVIVLDIMLPKLDGLSLLRQLRERRNACHVLLLTAKDAVPDRVAGLQAGADDYLVKPFAFEELVARIQALARRKHNVKEPVLKFGALAIDTATRAVKVGGRTVELPPREYSLLECLALHRGNVVSRPVLENAIGDGKSEPLSNVLDSAVCSLRRMIDLPDRPSFVQTRRGLGYAISVDEPG